MASAAGKVASTRAADATQEAAVNTSTMLRPGILFLETPRGGVLMDVDGDRFISLSQVSASIWKNLSLGRALPDVIDGISRVMEMPLPAAEALLASQLRRWDVANLTSTLQHTASGPRALPPNLGVLSEISNDEVQGARLVPTLMLSLYRLERRYRKILAQRGLAQALKAFQSEVGQATLPRHVAIGRTLRSYHAVRRMFRQGDHARDCLYRSLALATVLRRQGVEAELCIAVIDMPFASHAWVEADGVVLNEVIRKCERHNVIGRF